MAGGTNTERKKGVCISLYTLSYNVHVWDTEKRERERERDLPGVQDSQNPHQES